MAQAEQSTAFSHQAVGDADQAQMNAVILQMGENFRQRQQEAVLQQQSFMQENQLDQLQYQVNALEHQQQRERLDALRNRRLL